MDPTPIPAAEIAPDTYAVLTCGCAGVRGSSTDHEVPVMIVSPCASHAERQWAAHWVEDSELATPVPKGRERLFARWRRSE